MLLCTCLGADVRICICICTCQSLHSPEATLDICALMQTPPHTQINLLLPSQAAKPGADDSTVAAAQFNLMAVRQEQACMHQVRAACGCIFLECPATSCSLMAVHLYASSAHYLLACSLNGCLPGASAAILAPAFV